VNTQPAPDPTPSLSAEGPRNFGLAVFAALMGAGLGLSLLKFGNPVILDRMVEAPRTFWEFIFNPWPVRWGWVMLSLLVLLGIPTAGFRVRVPGAVLILPLVWFGWQMLASIGTVDAGLTQVTIAHFAACLAWFYLGVFCFGRLGGLGPFWIALLLAFAWVLWMGFDQHFGGLEATRKLVLEQGDLSRYPPEYLRRLASQRIFSTLFYPNSLAGVILLLLPGLLVVTGRATSRLSHIVQGVSVGLLGYAGLACLYWSGSKAGWLIAAGVMAAFLGQWPAARRFRIWWVGLIALLALGGFALRFSGYLERGATSAVARRDYWAAAWTTAVHHPFTGTGPGTFAIPYRQIKRPESEMAHLVHNDYLQQASDSGFVGLLAYAALIFGSLARLHGPCRADPLRYALWLGLAAWAAHSMLEFSLYIPALSWLPFALLGWLWASRQG
jgi:hypothetical protein